MPADDLTDRQRDVLRLAKENKNPTEIGRELGISSQGVHGHLRRLRTKGLLPSAPAPTRRPEPPRDDRSFDPASTISVVVKAITDQLAQLDARETEVNAEIERLQTEKREIADARKELEKLRPQTA